MWGDEGGLKRKKVCGRNERGSVDLGWNSDSAKSLTALRNLGNLIGLLDTHGIIFEERRIKGK